MDNKITALEACKLAGPTIEEMIADVYPRIKKAAEEKKRILALHDWANEGYSRTPAYEQLKKTLEADGFKVDFFYEERQFVNMYVTVEW